MPCGYSYQSGSVLFGEQHHQPSILKAQLCVLERMVTESKLLSSQNPEGTSSVNVSREMFNNQQQPLFDAYHANQISLTELIRQHIGTEGFVIENYGSILEVAKKLGAKLVAGLVPKLFCKMIIKEELNKALEKIEQTGGLPKEL